jgi:hypothetical protein
MGGLHWTERTPIVGVSFDAGESWIPLGTGLPEVELSLWNYTMRLVTDPNAHTLFLYDDPMGLWMLQFDPSSADDGVVLVDSGAWMSPGKPNPFSDGVSFQLRGSIGRNASVEVLDLGGRRIRTIHMAPGGSSTAVTWDGRLQDGSFAPSGVYFVRVLMPKQVMTRRVTLIH